MSKNLKELTNKKVGYLRERVFQAEAAPLKSLLGGHMLHVLEE